MTTTLKIILKIIFWLTIVFIIVTFYALTFGQSSDYEFADWKLGRQFYDILMPGLPVAILLTLTGSIKRTNDKSKNIIIIVVTIVSSAISLFILISMLFSVGYLTITNDILLYNHRTNQTTSIITQTIGQGASGVDGNRIVKLEPFLKFWNKTTIIDTTIIDKADWIFINKKIPGQTESDTLSTKIQNKVNKKIDNADEFCDTSKIADFKSNLKIIAEALTEEQKEYQLRVAKHFIKQSCESDTLFCEEIKFKNSTTYKYDNEWKLLLTGYRLDKQTGMEEKSASFFVLTILRNNEFWFTDIFEDLLGEIQAELNGFEQKEKQIKVWGQVYPYFQPEYGKFRLKIKNGTSEYEFQCRSRQ
jgi:hypothetical protein